MLSPQAPGAARTSVVLAVVCALAALSAAACAVEQVSSPIPTGPSSLATTVSLYASPITVVQDGVDRSTISVTVTDANGRPMATDLSSAIEVAGVASDFGSVSPRVARSDAATGIAQFVYTAPRAGQRAAEEVVTIVITPEYGGVDTATARRVSVRVVPPERTGPRTLGPLLAAFAVSPLTLATGTLATFDASTSRSGDGSCGTVCQFAWDFGDGAKATGLLATHAYAAAGTFPVTLTASDSEGTIATASATVIVTAQPTAVFHFSPTPVGVNQDVFLNATETRAAAGRRIVTYAWSFGDGTTGSGVTTSHRYQLAGTYTVLLTVTDDGRGVAHVTQSIPVGSTGTAPTAALTFSPQSPRAGTSVFFNATGSVAGSAAITNYRFNYGDGAPDDVGSAATQSHVFTSAGIYIVRVTVTDALGRTGTITVSVTVVP
jgi:PKD repeat protein